MRIPRPLSLSPAGGGGASALGVRGGSRGDCDGTAEVVSRTGATVQGTVLDLFLTCAADTSNATRCYSWDGLLCIMPVPTDMSRLRIFFCIADQTLISWTM